MNAPCVVFEAPTLAAQRGLRNGRDGYQHRVLGKGTARRST